MNKLILDHFMKKLLQKPKRVLSESGKIVEIYYEPERLNETDHNGIAAKVICDSLNTANK